MTNARQIICTTITECDRILENLRTMYTLETCKIITFKILHLSRIRNLLCMLKVP